jgi:ketosteroid isomerase-like protein
MKTSTTLAVLAAVVLGITLARRASGPGDTTPDDMVAVNRMLVSLDRIAAEADLEALLDYVSDDAVFLPPDRPAVVGKAAIEEMYAGLYERFRLEVRHEPRETDVFDGVIIHRGNATGTMTPIAGGEPVSFDNKYLFVIKKRPDGSLKIWRAIYNSNGSGAGGG